MQNKENTPKVTIINRFKTTDKDKLSEIITQKMSNIINRSILQEIQFPTSPHPK